MSKRTVLFLVVFAIAGVTRAMFMRPDLEKVPIERLLKNLEERLKVNPGDPALMQHLARTHAMAFSRKILDGDQVSVFRKKTAPWFGFTPKAVPYSRQTKRALNADQTKKVRAHLDKAIELYRKLAAKKRNDVTIQLNLAWCTEKSGETAKAVKMYRAIIKTTWATDKKARGGGMKGFTTVEAIDYLLPLLDEHRDAQEIKDLTAKKEQLRRLPRPITPIAIPVHNGVRLSQMIDREAKVRFDLDGTGRLLKWQWLTPAAAWLVYDNKGDGKIGSAIQLFGNRSFNLFLKHGYRALALLDDNRDGLIRGAELDSISVWHDANCNGVSDPGEVLPARSWGVVSVSCESSTHACGIQFAEAGITFADGSVRPTYDVILSINE